MASIRSWILILKVLLICTGALSLAMAMKFTVPSIVNFAAYELPLICSTVLSFLKPPYLFIIINAIIITVVACSRFHQYVDDETLSEPLLVSPAKPRPPSDLPSNFADVPPLQLDFPAVEESRPVVVVAECEYKVVDVKPVAVNGSEVARDEDLPVLSTSTCTPRQSITSSETEPDFLFPVGEKPLVSSNQRKPVKANREGGSFVRVAKPKGHETLENTWKMITAGRQVALKKSDTWENHGNQVSVAALERTTRPPMIKLETFKDRTNYEPVSSSLCPLPTSGKITREPSLSQEELNRRVEAFIKKFNEEMRLQRQQSLNQYREMIKRGAC